MDDEARQWHRTHRLGSGASLDDRVAWHLEHAKHCQCREMPEPIRREVERRGLADQLSQDGSAGAG